MPRGPMCLTSAVTHACRPAPQVVAEIETDKTSVPVPSPAAGVIAELFVEDGATVKPGTNLFSIKVGGTCTRRGDAGTGRQKSGFCVRRGWMEVSCAEFVARGLGADAVWIRGLRWH